MTEPTFGPQTLMVFGEWWSELKRLMVFEYNFSPTMKVFPRDWRDYYDKGFSPRGAIEEDLKHG